MRLLMMTILVACLGSAGSTVIADDKAAPLTFGVVPQQAASKLLAAWAPVLRHLENETGRQFIFRTAPDIPTFEKRLANGEYDFAYMNPYHFTVFNRPEYGYQAVARASDKLIRGILVVRKDSDVASLKDLQGQSLAFPAPAVFAASVLPQAHLRSEKVAFEPRYVSSHDSVYKTVARGFFPAGGGVMRTFTAAPAEVRDQLRVLWTTPGYTSHAIAGHLRVEPELRSKIQQALIDLDSVALGRKALDKLKLKGFQAAENADWDDVRRLGIDTKVGTQD